MTVEKEVEEEAKEKEEEGDEEEEEEEEGEEAKGGKGSVDILGKKVFSNREFCVQEQL